MRPPDPKKVVRPSDREDIVCFSRGNSDYIIQDMGIRDFIQYLEEHREKLQTPADLSPEEREETLRQAEMMVGMADAAIKELGSILDNRRINLPEEHAVRFAQDIFLHLREEEQRVKEGLREAAS